MGGKRRCHLLGFLLALSLCADGNPDPDPFTDININLNIRSTPGVARSGNVTGYGSVKNEGWKVGKELVEGRILQVDKRSGRLDVWPIGRPIPYAIDTRFTQSERGMIIRAVREIARESCIQFTRYEPDDPDLPRKHINYTRSDKCFTKTVGYNRRDPNANPIEFGPSHPCWSHNIRMHETMHVLGFHHEHARPDRDNYIRINWENIMQKQWHNFYKRSGSYRRRRTCSFPTCRDNPATCTFPRSTDRRRQQGSNQTSAESIFPLCGRVNNREVNNCRDPNEVDDLGEEYDPYSIMHSSWKAFSKCPGAQTFDWLGNVPLRIRPEDIGQQMQLSEADIRKLNRAYECRGRRRSRSRRRRRRRRRRFQ